MRKFISVVLSLLLIAAKAQAQTLDLSESELREVRKQKLEIAKQSCIIFWTETSKTQILLDAGITLDDQCRCTQDSVSYLVSDDLAAYASHALWEVRKNGIENLNPMLKSKLDEYHSITLTAMKGCSNKLMRRRVK